ncbi:hypothetical protein [Streptomyces sp. NPDC002520]
MIELAAGTLLRLMAGEAVRASRVELETRLIERGSTLSPP